MRRQPQGRSAPRRGWLVFKFQAIDAPPAFIKGADWTIQKMHQREALTHGWFGGIATISVDAVFIVNRARWHKDNASRGAVDEIGKAVDDAGSAIRMATRTPAN